MCLWTVHQRSLQKIFLLYEDIHICHQAAMLVNLNLICLEMYKDKFHGILIWPLISLWFRQIWVSMKEPVEHNLGLCVSSEILLLRNVLIQIQLFSNIRAWVPMKIHTKLINAFETSTQSYKVLSGLHPHVSQWELGVLSNSQDQTRFYTAISKFYFIYME